MANDLPCQTHEEQIQYISRKTAELETRANYKEKMIDDLNDKMDKMDEKMDTLLTGFHDFKLQSNKNDTELELRLKAIETKLELQDKQIQDNKEEHDKRLNRYFTIFGLAISAVVLVINYIH